MKLRNMIACVTEEPAITIELANGAARMRAIAREGVYNTEKEYAFSAGIVEGGRTWVY